ncbi:MAG: bifunctional acetate--CoA ligase family protein/GNAT family N-acetyltransferase [Terriglobales bacterium]
MTDQTKTNVAEPMTEKSIDTPSRHGLDAFFLPKSVAVVGATERLGTVGQAVLRNLIESPLRSKTYPVNPSHAEILGLKAYKTIGDVPEKVDLAIVATPASTVPGVIGECVDAGAKSAIVISAGFRERGQEGAALEKRIQEQLRRGAMRLIGPNCMGIMNPTIGLNATFANDPPLAGNVAFLSQSGALLTAILDWSKREQVGFSAIVSTGSMLDVGWGDLIDYFGNDPHTHSILLYMESIGNARSFLSAAREVALSKPVIVIKAGRSEAASRAAASHTGALTGSDEVLDAAFRRCGVLRVQNISDLFYMAEVLSKQPRPMGPRLTILTNAGGPGVLATDALIASNGQLATLSDETLRSLDQFLPPHWSHNNPIDVLGDADAECYAKALEVATKDPNSDGFLAILAPQGMADPALAAEGLKPYAKSTGKPLLASWMGGASIIRGEAILRATGIPVFPFPDTAARAFNYMWRYTYNLRGLYETPTLSEGSEIDIAAREQAAAIIEGVRNRGRVLLTEPESKQVLSLYGIPTVETRVARDEEEAVSCASAIGYPVVLKVFSETITHKTDVGGVKLDLRNQEAIRSAYRAIKASVEKHAGSAHFAGVTVQPMVRLEGYELILGSSVDPQFGPILLFGSGGQLVEVYRDRALALPPLNTTLAQRMMEQTRILTALKGVRGRTPVDLAALEGLLVRFSQLVVEHPRIAEIDINPLLASPERFLALDARVVLHDPALPEEQLPKPAIRPYPAQYISQWVMKNGTEVTVRPIRPEDEPLMVAFHETLSDSSVYSRYFSSLSLRARVAHQRLSRLCFVDYDREIALVADKKDPASGRHQLAGIGRLIKLHGTDRAEVAVLISDQYQSQGLGTELFRRLIQIARDEKVTRVSAEILADNLAMRGIAGKLGFRSFSELDLPSITAVLDLRGRRM